MKVLHTDDVDVTPLLVQMRLLIASEEEISRELAYIDCFKGVNLRRTAIVAFSFTIPSLFGVPFLASSSYFMQVVGMPSSLSVIILIIGIVLGPLANGVGVWFMGKFWRRPLLLWTLAISAVVPGHGNCRVLVWHCCHLVRLKSLKTVLLYHLLTTY